MAEAEENGENAPRLGESLVRLIGLVVDEPQEVVLEEATDDNGDRVYTVLVDYEDLGKVIGRQGRTARALRAFLDVRGDLDGRRYELEISERN
ncbi:MAG: KH domain-containing protein [Acidobacteriota bacterium]